MALRLLGENKIQAKTEHLLQLNEELQAIIDTWERRWARPYAMELTSEVVAGKITDKEYWKRENEFVEFGLNFLKPELHRLKQTHNPSATRYAKVIVEVGPGPGNSLSFHIEAMKEGFASELYECTERARTACEEKFEDMQMEAFGKLPWHTHQVIKFGLLQELFSDTPNALDSHYFVLGIFFRILQHNKKHAASILQMIPKKAHPLGRIVLATPYHEDNKQVKYQKKGEHFTLPLSRSFILEQINVTLPSGERWVYLREEKHFRGPECYTFAVLGPQTLSEQYQALA